VLKNEISKLLQKGMIQGRNPKELARELRKVCASSKYDSERLMRTEMARVQIEAKKLSYEENGYDEYEYVCCHKGDACSACKALDGEHFKTKKMMPGENAPPMHPNCHCSTCAYLDEESYNEWLDSYKDHKQDYNEWQKAKSAEKESSNKKYKYGETVVKKNVINSASYRNKFNNVSDDASINRTAYARAKEMLKHRSGTKYEDITFIDTKTGKSLINKGYDVENTAKPSKAMKRMLNKSEPGTIIAIHNHPGSSVPSISDLMVCMNRGYKFGLVACHDGDIYKYVVNKEKFNPTIAKLALDRMELKGYNDDVIKMFEDSGVMMDVL
jgi:SPP1 gp7 family putative phage head morphogenesis protein